MTTRMAADEAAADYIEANITAGAERVEQANCGQLGHSWTPNPYGRIECVRCSLAPHAPIAEETL